MKLLWTSTAWEDLESMDGDLDPREVCLSTRGLLDSPWSGHFFKVCPVVRELDFGLYRLIFQIRFEEIYILRVVRSF
jgi:hypothetical protein